MVPSGGLHPLAEALSVNPLHGAGALARSDHAVVRLLQLLLHRREADSARRLVIIGLRHGAGTSWENFCELSDLKGRKDEMRLAVGVKARQ